MTDRIGVGLLGYAVLLFGASLLLATSWVPSAMILAATLVSIFHASAGVAVMRHSSRSHSLIVASGGLHVALVAAWVVVLVSV